MVMPNEFYDELCEGNVYILRNNGDIMQYRYKNNRMEYKYVGEPIVYYSDYTCVDLYKYYLSNMGRFMFTLRMSRRYIL